MLRGNKGEWSEIYTFLKLLSMGKLHAADADLNKLENIYYPLIKIFRNEQHGSFEYEYGQEIRMIDAHDGRVLWKIPVSRFKEQSMLLFQKIRDARGRSFSIPEVEVFLSKMKCRSLKAKSSDKSDIHIMVYDQNTGMSPKLGFSIKSRLGGASTLLNAGKTTNFIYKISDVPFTEKQVEEINQIESRSKIRDRLKAIEDMGGSLSFSDISSEMFKLNLQVIDSLLPEMISKLLTYFYRGEATSLIDLLELLKRDNPSYYNDQLGHLFYEYKLKKFITDVALGMTPSKRWDGVFDATGGYIIVKDDGEVVCYHLYNHNEFQWYLLKNTKLDTPSSSRYDFAKIYKENGALYIKLNLQIRFV